MTFTIRLKEEITANKIDKLNSLVELSAFIRYSSQIKNNKIILTIENAAVARRIYKDIKSNFNINVNIIVRNQKRFRVKRIYILEISEKYNDILETLNIINNGKKTLPNEFFLESIEDKISFIKGIFLACGSVNDPAGGSYHLEFTSTLKKDGIYISKLLKEFNIVSKVIKRANHYMVYVKSAEMISDIIRMLGATNCFFYFEDIRIYRDHKNMVNRLNNCEQANLEKSLKTGDRQKEIITFLKDNDYFSLLDEKTTQVAEYRLKYPEESFQSLSEIMTKEIDKKVTKSYINHHFRKIEEIYNRIVNTEGKGS